MCIERLALPVEDGSVVGGSLLSSSSSDTFSHEAKASDNAKRHISFSCLIIVLLFDRLVCLYCSKDTTNNRIYPDLLKVFFLFHVKNYFLLNIDR